MKSYAIELYQSTVTTPELRRAAATARRAAESLTDEGMPVRYVRSLLIPEDETCFHLFEATSRGAVGLASRRAGLDYDRILEVVE